MYRTAAGWVYNPREDANIMRHSLGCHCCQHHLARCKASWKPKQQLFAHQPYLNIMQSFQLLHLCLRALWTIQQFAVSHNEPKKAILKRKRNRTRLVYAAYSWLIWDVCGSNGGRVISQSEFRKRGAIAASTTAPADDISLPLIEREASVIYCNSQLR